MVVLMNKRQPIEKAVKRLLHLSKLAETSTGDIIVSCVKGQSKYNYGLPEYTQYLKEEIENEGFNPEDITFGIFDGKSVAHFTLRRPITTEDQFKFEDGVYYVCKSGEEEWLPLQAIYRDDINENPIRSQQ